MCQRVHDRRRAAGKVAAVGARMAEDLRHRHADDLLSREAEHARRSGVCKSYLAVQIDAANAVARDVENLLGPGEGSLIEAPGDDAPDRRPRDEKGVDSG